LLFKMILKYISNHFSFVGIECYFSHFLPFCCLVDNIIFNTPVMYRIVAPCVNLANVLKNAR
jgi:hypothetical protein